MEGSNESCRTASSVGPMDGSNQAGAGLVRWIDGRVERKLSHGIVRWTDGRVKPSWRGFGPLGPMKRSNETGAGLGPLEPMEGSDGPLLGFGWWRGRSDPLQVPRI